jgi:uncharacterized linocin/CFP29 family protein
MVTKHTKEIAMSSSNEVNWSDAVWQDINAAVAKELGNRIAQKVFPTMLMDNDPTEVANEVINFSDLSIKEGITKQFVEIYQEFPLTSTQVSKESEKHCCRTQARMVAKSLALAEDTVLFQGTGGTLPPNVVADQRESAGEGLLGEANQRDASDEDPNKGSKPITVAKVDQGRQGLTHGENVFAAVAAGIAKLTIKGQAPKYSLFLPILVYADTFVPPSPASLVTTAERIKPLVEGGYYGTATLPADKGLLVAMAGEPTTLYMGCEAKTEFVRKEGSKYFFRVVERIQFVARDPRAFVLLNFARN